MLSVSLQRAAPRALARFCGLTACAWMAWMPAQAVDVGVPEQAAPAPFKQYQGWRDAPLDDWREANDRVGEIGGWRTYLRESQQADDGGMDRSGSPSGRHMHHGH